MTDIRSTLTQPCPGCGAAPEIDATDKDGSAKTVGMTHQPGCPNEHEWTTS